MGFNQTTDILEEEQRNAQKLNLQIQHNKRIEETRSGRDKFDRSGGGGAKRTGTLREAEEGKRSAGQVRGTTASVASAVEVHAENQGFDDEEQPLDACTEEKPGIRYHDFRGWNTKLSSESLALYKRTRTSDETV